MRKLSLSPFAIFTFIVIVTILFYLKFQASEDKNNQKLLKETVNKPIEQIEKDLSPVFLKSIQNNSTP